jgi:hypothetical protein
MDDIIDRALTLFETEILHATIWPTRRSN